MDTSIPWAQNTESNPTKALRCITIRRLLYFTPGSHRSTFGMVMLVANVYKEGIDSQGRRWFGFDDGLGKIDGYKKQVEGDFTFEPFAYARIIGEPEQHSNRALLKIFHIEPVYEAHEIFHHVIHAIMDTLTSERGPPPVHHHVPTGPSPTLLKDSQEWRNDIIAAMQEVSFSNDSGQNQTYISDLVDEILPDAAPRFKLSRLQSDIIACISNLRAEAGREGIHVTSVVQEMRSRHPTITVPEFCVATEHLLKEDVIYNMTDDEHYGCRNPCSSPRRRLSSENL